MSFLRHLLPAWKRGIENNNKANAAILAAIDKELKDTEKESIKSKLLMSLNTASEEWLDQYGKLFGVLRREGEEDDTYRNRIISYVLLKRGTIPAIKAAIRDFLNDYESYIEIYEPYKNIFTLNKSKLNGEDHFLGEYYTVAVIDIKLSRPFPIGIIDVINEFKPAGVTFRLTYRPSSHNPDAGVVSLPLDSSIVLYPETQLTILNGMNAEIRGHMNLTDVSRDGDANGLFTLNKSNLNSLDRLAGSLSATNANYNLVTFSLHDLTLSEDSKIEDVLNNTDSVSPDFYTKTGRVDGQYAAQTIYAGADSYLYLTMDVATYLNLKYSKYLREVEPSGVYTKETYAQLMGDCYLQYRLNAMVTEEVNYSLEAFNLSTGGWESLKDDTIGSSYKSRIVPADEPVSYLTDSGLMFVRLAFPSSQQDADVLVYQAPNFGSSTYELTLNGGTFTENTTEETISGNYERTGETFDIRLDFFELGFSKDVNKLPGQTVDGIYVYDAGDFANGDADVVLDGSDFTDNSVKEVVSADYTVNDHPYEVAHRFVETFYVGSVTGITTITDTTVPTIVYNGGESPNEVYEFNVDGGAPEDHTYTEIIDGNYKES
jgi:hypothetical protein